MVKLMGNLVMSLKYVGVALGVASAIMIMNSAARAADDIVAYIKTVQPQAAIIIEGIEEESSITSEERSFICEESVTRPEEIVTRPEEIVSIFPDSSVLSSF